MLKTLLKIKSSVFFIVMLCVSSTVYATTRYVSTAGFDSNSCATSVSPGASAKRNLNGASGGISCMSAGDVLIVQDGVYDEQISDIVDSEHPGTTAPPSGTSTGARTIIKSENYRGATLRKSAVGPPVNHVVLLSQTDFISIEDFILDSGGHGTCVWLGPGTATNGGRYKLSGNYITNCGGNGLYADHDGNAGSGQGYEILNNEVVNVSGEFSTTPGAHAMYNIGRNGVTSGNYIHGSCPFYGIHFTSETGGVTGNIIENNRVVGCDQAGIVNQGSVSVVRNNLLENNGIGIQCQGSGNQKIYNNTIFNWHSSTVNPDSYGIFAFVGCDIRNNLILQQRVSSFQRYIYYDDTSVFPTLQNNMCDNTPERCQLTSGVYSTVVIDGYGGNLQLVSTGGAVDAGVTLSTDVPLDRLGVSRPSGGAYDVGAYEFVTGGADTDPPTVSVTAPSGGATVSGSSVSITASASDNVGVVGVQFKLSGGNIGSEDTTVGYGITWDSTTVSNGSYSITAVARDAAGNSTTSSAVMVTVSNVVSGSSAAVSSMMLVP